MASIKITQPTNDAVTNKAYKVGDIINLGALRNKRAVETNQAVWVTSKELAKEESKADNTENTTEKVEQVQGANKTTSSARGKKIETKTKLKKED